MSICFAEILHAGRAAIAMKHIKQDFSLKAWVLTFSENGNVAYQIKADDACSNMEANIYPQTHP